MRKEKYWIILSLVLSIFASKAFSESTKDSLLNIIDKGTKGQKISAFYNLAKIERDLQQAIALYDSAEYYYHLNPNDSDLMYLYGLKAMTFKNGKKYVQAINYAKKAIEIAEKIDRKKDIESMYVISSNSYKALHLFDSAIFFREKTIPLYKKMLSSGKYSEEYCNSNIAYSSLELGRLYYRSQKNDIAIQYLYKALRIYENLNNIDRISRCHLNIGNVFNFEKNYKKAAEEYQKGLKYSKIVNNKILINVFLTNIGTVYMAQNQYDSANYYFDRSLEYALEKNNNQFKIAGLYNNKALIKKHIQQYDSALFYFNKSLKYYSQINYKNGEISTKTNIAITLIKMKEYEKSKTLLFEILDYSLANNMYRTNTQIYLALSKIYTEQHQYKNALEAYQNHIVFYDSINSVIVRNRINDYRERYETEKKDQEIKLLEKQAEVNLLKQEKQEASNRRNKITSILLGIIVVFLIISIVFIQRYFMLRHKAAQELIHKNAEINQRKIVDLVKDQEVKSINSFMSGQEKERSRIAAELHDRLGSLLSAVKLHFSSIEADMHESSSDEKESFSFALKLLDNSVDEVRAISHNLSKGVLMSFGIVGAIKNLCDTINTAGQLQIKFIEAGTGFNLKPEIEVELFRVIQELITNAIKHSQADEIFVQLISDNDGLSVVVEDQGVGFNMRKLKNKGIGLMNLKSRVEKIGGEYNIESSEGQGTTVIIEIKNRS